MICRTCHHPFNAGSSDSTIFCADCLQKGIKRSLGRSASPYPHNVTVRLLDSRQLAVRN